MERLGVIEGGAFAKLQATGFKLRWPSRAAADDPARVKDSASKTKYACPGCGKSVWAKPDALLIRRERYEEGEG